MIQVVKLEEALGYPLAHDITEIRPGEFKGPAFHRGHILENKDLEYLRRLGKNHLYVLVPEKNEMHEDDAAIRLANVLCGDGVGWSGVPREGKITLKATRDGLLKVDVGALMQFNMVEEVMCATRHTHTMVQRGDSVAGTRAIPLLIATAKVQEAVNNAQKAPEGVLRVLPLRKATVGVMITGNEVYYKRIEDKFEPVIRQKVTELGGDVMEVTFLPDDDQRIATTAVRLIEQGANMLITTGGMSVDPDDRTRFALKKAGAKGMVYGTPVLPGAMFMVAYINDVPIMGIPACGMYASRTILDLIYPRVLAGETITRKEIAALGHGGLCLQCPTCRFPCCPFGKAG